MLFCYFIIISPWKRHWPSKAQAGPFIWPNLHPLHPRMLCAKFGWNWPSGFGEENFLISKMYFRYFIIISHLNKLESPSSKRCFVPSLVEIGPVVLQKTIFIFRQCLFFISPLSPLGKGIGTLFELTWIFFNQECVVLSLVKISQVALEKNFFSQFRLCIFAILLSSPFEKGRGPSFEETWISFTQGCFVPSLFEIGSVVLE